MGETQDNFDAAESIEAFQGFSQRLGIPFKDPSLLRRALTHRSYLNEHPDFVEDNERLEFLGDAVLDFLVASWLYHHFPEMAEGNLTRLRAALVGNAQLAEFARDLGAGEAMLLGKGEHDGGGRIRSALLGSIFEAVVGALYLDQGIDAVRSFVEPMLTRTVQQILLDRLDIDPKSQLQEWAQANGLGAPIYRTAAAQGPDHAKVFVVEVLIASQIYARGEGHSKQAAAKAAARQAILNLGL
jgi:ribonuclease III